MHALFLHYILLDTIAGVSSKLGGHPKATPFQMATIFRRGGKKWHGVAYHLSGKDSHTSKASMGCTYYDQEDVPKK